MATQKPKTIKSIAKKLGVTPEELTAYIEKAVAKELKKYKAKAESILKKSRQGVLK